jgi:UDP-2,3-diacylglucosamine pyrophosphatase LpxH
MIIAISDLHLGDPVSNRTGFSSFIEDFLKPRCDEITDLVLLGDILDLWRRNCSAVIRDNLNILNDVCSLGFHIHYIAGNHDFIMKQFGPDEEDASWPRELTCKPNNMTISDSQLLNSGGEKFRFIHGHQMNYWYALPFYEAFSRAMCEVDEEVEELSNVWKILRKHSGEIPIPTFEKIMKLSDEQKSQIDRKLAGPLVGHSTTIEESIIEDYHLLQGFSGFYGTQSNRKHAIHEEILALSSELGNVPNIERLVALAELGVDSSFDDLASNFLNAWIDIFQWVHSNKMKVERKDLTTLVGRIQRISSMFSTDLENDEFLIHGHGHNGHVDYTNRMADAGCWIEDKASYLSIDNGKVSYVRWPKK